MSVAERPAALDALRAEPDELVDEHATCIRRDGCVGLVLPVILDVVKTAISLPDELSAAIDACARELKMTRSGLLAQAAREFVARRRRASDSTEAWNRVIDRAGQPGDDPAARAFRRRTKAVIRESGRGRR
jgi:predicted transcriptional regulator